MEYFCTLFVTIIDNNNNNIEYIVYPAYEMIWLLVGTNQNTGLVDQNLYY